MRREPVPALLASLLLAALGTACGEEGVQRTSTAMVFNEVDVHGRDWVELVNPTTGALDLSGWMLSDRPDDPAKRYVLPAGTVAQPGGYLVIKGEDAPGDGTGFTFGLGAGEAVYLLDPQGALALEQPIGTPGSDRTWGRYPDSTGDWRETRPTQGETNDLAFEAQAVLFSHQAVTTIDLGVAASDLPTLDDELQDAGGGGDWVPGTFKLTAGDQTFPQVTGRIRLKGGLSYRHLSGKASFMVKFGQPGQDQRFLGLKGLVFNGLVQDPSAMHEALAYQVFGAGNVPTLRTGYAELRLNGTPYGLYVLLEPWDDVTLARSYTATSHLYEGIRDLVPANLDTFVIKEGDELDRSDLKKLISSVNNSSDQAFMAALGMVADVRELATFMVIEDAVGQRDGYAWAANNYYLHANGQGVFSLLPWGADQAFSELLAVPSGSSVLATRCFAIQGCADLAEGARKSMAGVLAAPTWLQQVDALDTLLRPHLEADPRREWDLAQHDAAVRSLRDFLSARAQGL
jgi:hypothetical protein